MTVPMRRVDYRRGTDEDVPKIYRAGADREGVRRAENMPPQLDKFLKDARAFPAYFHEWSLLFETPEGEPAATAAAWYREGADPEWLEFDAWVRKPWRRRGIGTRALTK